MKPYRLLFAVFAVLLGAMCVSAAHAAPQGVTLRVNSTQDKPDAIPGDGLCETGAGNGICTLRAAIQETNALGGKNKVIVPAGSFQLTRMGAEEDNADTGDLDIKSKLVLRGAGASQTMLEGRMADRVFDIQSGKVKLSGISIRHGQAVYGGAIRVRPNAKLTLDRSEVLSSVGERGGGIYVLTAALVLHQTTMRENSAIDGGAIYAETQASVIAQRSTFDANEADQLGGAMYLYHSDLTLENSAVTRNTATQGGGIFMLDYTLRASNSTFSRNAATNGGGIYVNGVNAWLQNLTITENSSDGIGYGGGITITNNALVKWGNSIVAGNTNRAAGVADNCFGAVNSQGYNLMNDPTGCTLTGKTDTDQTTVKLKALKLGPLQNNGGPTETHALLTKSRAIDAGDPAGCLDAFGIMEATDQRGSMRPTDGDGKEGARCDVGAFER